MLKGSWDLVSRVIIRVAILITPIKVLITLLTKSHDPPSGLSALLQALLARVVAPQVGVERCFSESPEP